jgi:hypothetical protein
MGKALADPEAVRAERLAALAARTPLAKIEKHCAEVDRMYRNAPTRGRMNKAEAAYAEQLELWKRAGHLRDWKYGALSLRLADRTWYRPDFFVTANAPHANGLVVLEIHEVKGHWEDDARVKFKVAAELYPMFRFLAVRRVRSGFNVIETLNA